MPVTNPDNSSTYTTEYLTNVMDKAANVITKLESFYNLFNYGTIGSVAGSITGSWTKLVDLSSENPDPNPDNHSKTGS